MSDHQSRGEQEALLAAGRDGALEPDEAADVSMLAELLADPATWAEPPAGLEDAIVRAIDETSPTAVDSRSGATGHRQRLVRAVLGVAAAIVIVIIAATATVKLTSGTSADYAAQLTGTELAPGANASGNGVRSEAGVRITLDAHGLPPLPAGEYYQAWLKNSAGTLVPIGTFSSSDGRVTLWSGVSPTDFPMMTVTIEDADNNQASSGRRVLEGELRAA